MAALADMRVQVADADGRSVSTKVVLDVNRLAGVGKSHKLVKDLLAFLLTRHCCTTFTSRIESAATTSSAAWTASSRVVNSAASFRSLVVAFRFFARYRNSCSVARR